MTHRHLPGGILELIDQRERSYEHEIASLREEVEYWKNRWWSTVHDSIQHNFDLSGMLLKAALDGLLAPKKDDSDDRGEA